MVRFQLAPLRRGHFLYLFLIPPLAIGISLRYIVCMIKSTKGKLIGRILSGERAKGFPSNLIDRAEVTIAAINAAQNLDDLRIPPSNRLEKLIGKRKGQYSIRINNQWRICFFWEGEDAFSVEIVDYH